MNQITTKYDVRFVNSYKEFNDPLEIKFTATDPGDVKHVVSALSAYFSGDPCQCFINGEEAVLDNDWGLHDPTA